MRIYYASIIVLSVLLASTADAITIDDFSSGPLDITSTETSPSTVLVQAGIPESAVVGGVRRNVLVLNAPLVPGSVARVTIDTNSGTYRVTTNSNLEGFALSYGDGPSQALDLDLSGYRAIRIDVISSVMQGEASFALRSGDNESSGGRSDFQRFNLPVSDTPYSLFVPFDDFVRGVDFSDIDFIEIVGGGPGGFDLVLGGIFVVPEPSTAGLLLAVGMALFMTRPCRMNR